MVAVVVASFFAAITIATWSSDRCGRSSVEPLGTWLTWSMVDVVGARWSCSGRGGRGLWSTWSELSGAARDVVRGRRGQSSASLAGRLDVAHSAARSVARRGLRDGLTTARTACFRLAWRLDFMLSGTLACISHVDLLHTRVRCVHTPLMKSSCMHAYMVYAAVNQ